MDDPSASRLEDEYETERHRASQSDGEAGLWSGNPSGVQGDMGRVEETQGGKTVEVQVLPTLDGRGRLYDVGLGEKAPAEDLPGNRRKRGEKYVGCFLVI